MAVLRILYLLASIMMRVQVCLGSDLNVRSTPLMDKGGCGTHHMHINVAILVLLVVAPAIS